MLAAIDISAFEDDGGHTLLEKSKNCRPDLSAAQRRTATTSMA
jgi:hypothetical protein